VDESKIEVKTTDDWKNPKLDHVYQTFCSFHSIARSWISLAAAKGYVAHQGLVADVEYDPSF
jgi:hypothetical protein